MVLEQCDPSVLFDVKLNITGQTGDFNVGSYDIVYSYAICYTISTKGIMWAVERGQQKGM